MTPYSPLRFNLHLRRKGKVRRSLIFLICNFSSHLNVSMSSLPIEEHYVGFEVLAVRWNQRTTWHYIPQDSNLSNHCYENLISYNVSLLGATYWHIRRFEKLWIKNKFLCTLPFLLGGRLTFNGLHGITSQEDSTFHNHWCENFKSYTETKKTEPSCTDVQIYSPTINVYIYYKVCMKFLFNRLD
jgi:hypothetical protein